MKITAMELFYQHFLRMSIEQVLINDGGPPCWGHFCILAFFCMFLSKICCGLWKLCLSHLKNIFLTKYLFSKFWNFPKFFNFCIFFRMLWPNRKKNIENFEIFFKQCLATLALPLGITCEYWNCFEYRNWCF